LYQYYLERILRTASNSSRSLSSPRASSSRFLAPLIVKPSS